MSENRNVPRKRIVDLDDVFSALAAFECDHPAASRLTALLLQVYRDLDCLELATEYAERDPEFDLEWLPSNPEPETFSWDALDGQ